MNVVALVVTMRLTDIVKEQRNEQECRILERVQQQRKTMRLRQLLNVADGNQRMFIHGVLVKEIANDAASNFFKIRKDPSEQPDFVHREQRLVYALAIL